MRYPDDRKITAAQVRAARVILRITAQELADLAGVGVATVRRSEAGDGEVSVRKPNAVVMRQALEREGIIFLLYAGTAPGVAKQD